MKGWMDILVYYYNPSIDDQWCFWVLDAVMLKSIKGKEHLYVVPGGALLDGDRI